MDYIMKMFLSWVLEVLHIRKDEIDTHSVTFDIRKWIAVGVFIGAIALNGFLLRGIFVAAEDNLAIKHKLETECEPIEKPKE